MADQDQPGESHRDPSDAVRAPLPTQIRPPGPPRPSPTGRPSSGDSEAPGTGTDERSESERFGRVDGDGNIFVTLPDGNEHFVGQWTAGDPQKGLSLYAHRFDDAASEVELTGRRLTEGRLSPDEAQRTVDKLRQMLVDPKLVGDLGALAERLQQLEVAIGVRREVLAEQQAQARTEAAEKRSAIVAEAQSLAESTAWRSTADRFRSLVEQWKGLPRFDRAAEQEQWRTFSSARSTFDRARRSHFQEQEKAHQQAKQRKEQLVAKAEELSVSTEWGPTAAALRELMDEWKKAGFAGKPADDKLWKAFRKAQDAFFDARKQSWRARDSEYEEHKAAKLALISRAEALLPVSDPTAARKAFRALQSEYVAVGHVARADKPKLDKKMARVDAAIREAEESAWRRSDPARNARAAEMVAMYESSVAKLADQVAAAEASGSDASELRESLAAQEEMLRTARKYL